MRRFVDLKILDRLDHLIRRKATGSPEELAKRLNISRSNLFEIIKYLREEMQAPIVYNSYIQSYEYEYLPKFYLGFERDRLNASELYYAFAGVDENKTKTRNFKTHKDDEDIIPDDINFNDFDFDF